VPIGISRVGRRVLKVGLEGTADAQSNLARGSRAIHSRTLSRSSGLCLRVLKVEKKKKEKSNSSRSTLGGALFERRLRPSFGYRCMQGSMDGDGVARAERLARKKAEGNGKAAGSKQRSEGLKKIEIRICRCKEMRSAVPRARGPAPLWSLK